MNTSELDLPFLFRTVELTQGARQLAPDRLEASSRLLVIRGDSGVGKSAFCRALLSGLVETRPEIPCIYLDIRGDEFFVAHLFECLCYLTWNEFTWDADRLVRIPKGRSFSHFLHEYNVRKDLVRYLHGIATSAADLLPAVGSKLAKAIPEPKYARSERDPVPDMAGAFFAYLKKLAGPSTVYFVLDNYQFLPPPLRLLLEAQFSMLATNLGLVLIDRTKDGASELTNQPILPSGQQTIILHTFDEQQVLGLISPVLKNRPDAPQIARHCFLSTSGNLKEVELYLRRLLHSKPAAPGSGIELFLDAMSNLPELHRRVLALAALFPAGLKFTYLNTILEMIAGSKPQQEELAEVATSLTVLGYIVINSRNGETMRAAHEKVISAVHETISDREILLVRKAAIGAFDALLRTTLARSEVPYLLHCLVGILTGREYEREADKIAWLVDLEYRADKFLYVANLYRSFPDSVLTRLPEHALEAILDSMQKISEFNLGMTAIQRLRTLGIQSEYFDRALVRYLTQTYRYSDALRLLDRLTPCDELELYRLTVLQYLGRDDDARFIVDDFRSKKDLDFWGAIALRNSAHLYPLPLAFANLERAVAKFEAMGAAFENATTLNNLGIVCLWSGNVLRATALFVEARGMLAGLASNEIYQPLINLGVTSLVGHQVAAGLSYFEEARQWLPNLLLLDQLILDADITIAEIAADKLSLDRAEQRFADLYAEAKTIDDAKLHDHLGFNLAEIRKQLGTTTAGLVSEVFLTGVEKRERTGFECFVDVEVSNTPVRFLLSLSPHWRY